MFDLEETLKLLSDQTILRVGDPMLEDFVYGRVARTSPEGPPPALAVTRSELEIGGPGNGALNIAALQVVSGCDVSLRAPSDSKPLIQQIHITAAKTVRGLVNDRLFPKPTPATTLHVVR
jgi:bifunctional ADP-heptose synthase (sugar kinase/adenylyltransferase)